MDAVSPYEPNCNISIYLLLLMNANRAMWSLRYADQFTGSQMLDPFQRFGYCMSNGGWTANAYEPNGSMNEWKHIVESMFNIWDSCATYIEMGENNKQTNERICRKYCRIAHVFASECTKCLLFRVKVGATMNERELVCICVWVSVRACVPVCTPLVFINICGVQYAVCFYVWIEHNNWKERRFLFWRLLWLLLLLRVVQIHAHTYRHTHSHLPCMHRVERISKTCRILSLLLLLLLLLCVMSQFVA